MGIKISELPPGAAEQTALAPASNAEGTETLKVTLMAIASLATKQTVGLSNVDNTSDLKKPISTAAQNALDGKLSVLGGAVCGSVEFTSSNTSMSVSASGITFPDGTRQTTATIQGSQGTTGIQGPQEVREP